MKSTIVKYGEKDTPVRIWVGEDGFYMEYFERENYVDLTEEESVYLTTNPENHISRTSVFFGYMKDVIAYALKHIENLKEKKIYDGNTVEMDITKEVSVETTTTDLTSEHY